MIEVKIIEPSEAIRQYGRPDRVTVVPVHLPVSHPNHDVWRIRLEYSAAGAPRRAEWHTGTPGLGALGETLTAAGLVCRDLITPAGRGFEWTPAE